MTRWICAGCGEVFAEASQLRIVNEKGEYAHGTYDGGNAQECGPVEPEAMSDQRRLSVLATEREEIARWLSTVG